MKRFFVLAAMLWISATALGQTANEKLLTALRDVNARAAKDCLMHGAEANARDTDGVTALMYATLYADTGIVKWLLAQGADPNAKSKAGVTALMLAVGSVEKVRLLLAKGAEVNARTAQGQNALGLAAGRAGSAEVVKLLLDHQADIRSGNPLAAAARSGDLAVVKLLLARGADPNNKNRLGGAPAASAKRIENVKQAGGILRPPLPASIPTLASEYTPLVYAAYARNLTVAQLLVARGAAVNAAGANHTTPLMIAAQQADAPMVKWLLAQGADAKLKNDFDYTALLFAVASERTDAALVKTLLASGADLNAQGKDGETPLKLAARKGNTDIVRLLTQAGAK